MRYKNWPIIRRDTPGDLFTSVLNLVVHHGHYGPAGEIMDYASPESMDKRELTNYEFDFQAIVNTGNSEGIYIDCLLYGNFDSSEDTRVSVGTFKTLRDDVEAYKIMGELSGAMVAYAHMFVNRNIERYTPEKERLSTLAQYNMDDELIERFHELLREYNAETTRHWLRFLSEHNESRSYQVYKAAFATLVEQFTVVKEDYGPEIAQALYHNVWALALDSKRLLSAARYLKEGHTCVELCALAEKGFLF